jgi:hypothetical protein
MQHVDIANLENLVSKARRANDLLTSIRFQR